VRYRRESPKSITYTFGIPSLIESKDRAKFDYRRKGGGYNNNKKKEKRRRKKEEGKKK
jgi:hypothetical protein